MTKVEKFKKLIKDEVDNYYIIDYCYDHTFGGTRVFIYPNNVCFSYVYRQLAYYSSTWLDVYITGISMDHHIIIYFDGEVFDL